ncbi:hypothetical protein Ancab_028428, partial [Ancistrocladus abbreviatus]
GKEGWGFETWKLLTLSKLLMAINHDYSRFLPLWTALENRNKNRGYNTRPTI